MMVYKKNRACPTIICDACGAAVLESGNVLWDPDRPDRLYYVHKGRCTTVMEDAHQPVPLHWEERSWFLVFVANNAKLPPRTLVKKEAMIKHVNF
jgi:hypothetical protein